jgi:hypothetical protein
MSKKILFRIAPLALAAGIAFAVVGQERDPNRPDCPGLIVCPLTGEKICADRCPLTQSEADEGAAKAEGCPNCRERGPTN